MSANNILIGLVIGILVYLIFDQLYKYFCDNTEHIVSETNGRKYLVRDQGDDDQKIAVANNLGTITDRMDQLVSYMVEKGVPSPEVANRLYHRWKDCNIRETGAYEKTAAYTVNKGEEMRLCLRSGDGVLPLNTSIFVVLHEMAHMMSITYGHNDEFKENFSNIVHLASSLGYYRPENFQSNPQEYCGTVINTSPCMYGTCEYTSIPNENNLMGTRGILNLL